MHVFLIMGLSRASTNLLARVPADEPIRLIVLLHGLPRPSSELIARTQTCIPALPTMNSLAHSIPKWSMNWTPSLIHPNKGTSGELNHSRSACGPPDTNSSLMSQIKHIPDHQGLSQSSSASQQSFQPQLYPPGAAIMPPDGIQANRLAHNHAPPGAI